jgi:hypothetical protein
LYHLLHRHARHPRPLLREKKTWMLGPSSAMTSFVIASETRQSRNPALMTIWIASSLTLLAMTVARRRPHSRFKISNSLGNTPSHSRKRFAPRALLNDVPQRRGRRECRMPSAPAVSRANGRSTRALSPQVRRNIPAFPARWFYGFLRDLPGVRDVLVTVIGAMQSIVANLAPAKGRQNHTTSPSALMSFV